MPRPANVVTNYLAGREFADSETARGYENQLRGQSVKLGEEFQNLAHNANATPDQYARIGRSDVSNALVNNERHGDERKMAAAQKLLLAAQWADKAPPGQTKAFVEQNFPELVQHAGASWATATDEQVRESLQGVAAKFGAQAGVGPAQPKDRGLITGVGPDGKPVRVMDEPGAPVYTAPEKPKTRFRPARPDELRAYGLPDGTPAKVNIDTDELVPLNNPAAGGSKTFRNIQSLRKEFEGMEAVKNYKLVLPLYERAVKAPNTRAGDVSVIYALGKMFDPGSVVREGELILSQNTAPWLQKLTAGANSQITGEGSLNPETRKAIMDALNGQVEALSMPYRQERERFAQYADENGWTPQQVVGSDPSAAFVRKTPEVPKDPAGGNASPVRVNSPQEAMALPSGTVFITPDGRQKVRP